MKILEATSRESESLTGTEYLPFSDSADSTDGRVSTGELKTYIASELEETVNANASDISSLQTSVATNTTNIATNASDISSLQTSVATNTTNIATSAKDILQLKRVGALPFDGFVSGVSYSSGAVGSGYNGIYYDTEQQLFLAFNGSTYYLQWDNRTSDDMYNSDSDSFKDKVYVYNKQLYVWDDEEETLVVAKPEVINNLTSSDTDVALSAYQGKVLNEAIEELEDLVDANTSDIGTLEETINAIESVSDDDIESLFE